MIRSAVKGSLAYSEGHQLTDCLDLLRAPAEHLWVEWADGARRDEFLRANPMTAAMEPMRMCCAPGSSSVRRVVIEAA
jgi:hypothetical protein